jgi:hypothetical protein
MTPCGRQTRFPPPSKLGGIQRGSSELEIVAKTHPIVDDRQHQRARRRVSEADLNGPRISMSLHIAEALSDNSED